MSGVFPGMGLPFQMLKGIEVSGFILLGLAGRRWLQGLQRRISGFLTILTVIGYAAFATIAVLATSAHSSLWIALASTLAMFFGVYAFTFLSIAIQKNDLLEYVGRNSLVFYAVNAFMLNVGKLVFFRLL